MNESTTDYELESVKAWLDQRERLRYWACRAAMATFVLTPMIFGAYLHSRWRPLLYLALVGLAGLAAALFVLFSVTVTTGLRSRRMKKNSFKGRLVVEPDFLSIDGMKFARGKLEQGWSILRERLVVIRISGVGDLAISGLDTDHRASLLQALGLGPTQRTLSLPIDSVAASSRWTGCLILVFIAVLLPFGAVFGLTAPLVLIGLSEIELGNVPNVNALLIFCAIFAVLCFLFWIAIWRTIRFLQRRIVTVGADGVTVEGHNKTRSYSYGKIVRVKKVKGGILDLRDGTEISLPRVNGGAGLADRIYYAQAAYKDLSDAPPIPIALDQLSRSDLEPEAWKERLGQLSRGEAGYRSTSTPLDLLVEVAENPTHSPEHRVGAAHSLAAKPGAPQTHRHETAPSTTANPNLRRALQEATQGRVDLRALEAAEKM